MLLRFKSCVFFVLTLLIIFCFSSLSLFLSSVSLSLSLFRLSLSFSLSLSLFSDLVALFYKEGASRGTEVDPKLLADYISFARLHIHPKITDDAARALVEGYVDMRMVGNSVNHARNKKLITATPRQLEAIIRLSEAHARLHYRLEVGREDVIEAVRLMNVATQRAATDPTTGTIDMDMITTGQTATGRQLIGMAKDGACAFIFFF